MSDLISRKEMLRSYQELCRNISCSECSFYFGDTLTGDCLLEKWIHSLPSAEPERKTGKWIDQDEGAFYPIECSECHKEPLLDAYGDYVYSDFCPNCGADMRGDNR